MPEEKQSYERLDSISVSMTSKCAFSFEFKRYYCYTDDDPELVIKSIKKMLDNRKSTFKSIDEK